MRMIILVLSGYLWRKGGKDFKPARVLILPAILSVYLSFVLKNPLYLLLVLPNQIFRIGYGIPDTTDKGSWLGRLLKIDWLTRGVAGALYSLSFMPLYIASGHWIKFAGYLAQNFLIGAIGTKLKLNAKYLEPLIGAGVASIIYWR